MKLTVITLVMTMFSTVATAQTDKTQHLNGVSLSSSKIDINRTFTATSEKEYAYPISLIKKSVTNFSDICNNDFQSWREYIPAEHHCKHHNENIIETFVVKEYPYSQSNNKEQFLIGKRTYNRGNSNYYELVDIEETQNIKSQKIITIRFKMLTDTEAQKLIKPKFNNDSAFDQSFSTLTLTELSPYKTHLKYEYSAITDHWLLNKEVVVPQVFASISKSINNLLSIVENESGLLKRKMASQN